VGGDEVLAHNVDPSCDPAWLKRLKAGRAFDETQKKNYDYNQVYVYGKNTDYVKLDSYNPTTGEIVSRKLTQLGEVGGISEKSAFQYLNELASKYSEGTKIANVPSNGDLAGKTLEGQMYLEVPVQQSSISQTVLNYATKLDIKIRDINGNLYN
jgi:hypothetical protein